MLVWFSGVFHIECQVLVCVLVSVTPCGNCWPALLCLLHRVSRIGLCSYVSYTMCQGLCVLTLIKCQRLVHVFVRLKLSDKCWADSNVSFTVFQWMACILMGLTLGVKC